MRFQTALVAATSVTSISAFLVAPEIVDAVNAAKSSLTKVIGGATQSVDVKCHDCPIFLVDAQGHGSGLERDGVSHDKVETTLHLDFSDKAGTLQINNETVFPLEAINHQFPKLSVHQTRLDTGENLATVPVDFVLSAHNVPRPRGHPHKLEVVKEDGYELVTVDFTIIGMAGIPIKSQTAHADLILHDGVYSLARLRAAEFNPTAPGENDLEVCKSARNVQLCRVKLIANRKLRELIQGALARSQGLKQWMKNHGPGNKPVPCHKPNPGRIGTTMTDGHEFRHGQHGQHGQHGEHGHRYRHNRVVHAFTLIVKGLLVPALAGFAFGFTVSAVGLLVGKLIAFLWTRLYRGRRVQQRTHTEITMEDGEKEGLMANGEAPPACGYRDEVAVYTDADTKSETRK